MKNQRYALVLKLTLGLALAGTSLSPAFAEETGATDPPFVKFLKQDYLFGNWGGLRTDLSEHGVDFEFLYAASTPQNLSGGIRDGGVYQGGLLMTLDLDSKKLVGYEGGQFHVGSLWLNGHKPFSEDYVGDLNKVNLLDFPNAFRLWELWYQQKILDGKVAVKVGQMSVDRDFIVSDMYNSLGGLTLLNQTFFFPTIAFDLFGVPGLPSQHHGLPSTPNTALGALLRWEPSPHFYAQIAGYSGEPDQSYHGTDFIPEDSNGALLFFELGYKRNFRPEDSGLRTSLKLGGWYHTGEFVDVYEGILSAVLAAGGGPSFAPATIDGNYGVYFQAEQELFREKDSDDPARQGLVGFVRAGGAPPDRNLADIEATGGLVYKGLIPSRDYDTFAVAGSYLRISDDITGAQEKANLLMPGLFVPADYEGVLEVSYKMQLAAWWTVQASYEYVLHPGGSPELDNANVVILQTVVRF